MHLCKPYCMGGFESKNRIYFLFPKYLLTNLKIVFSIKSSLLTNFFGKNNYFGMEIVNFFTPNWKLPNDTHVTPRPSRCYSLLNSIVYLVQNNCKLYRLQTTHIHVVPFLYLHVDLCEIILEPS